MSLKYCLTGLAFCVSVCTALAQYGNEMYLDSGDQNAGATQLIPIGDHQIKALELIRSQDGYKLSVRELNFITSQYSTVSTIPETELFHVYPPDGALILEDKIVVGSFGTTQNLSIFSPELQLLHEYEEQGADTIFESISALLKHPQGGYLAAGSDAYFYSNGAGVDRIDSRLWRFDENAELIWKQTGGLSWYGNPYTICLNEAQEIILIGNCLIPGGTGGQINYDMAITKFDSLGNLLELETWGSLHQDLGTFGIQLSPNSAIICYTQTTSIYPEILPYHLYGQMHVELLDLVTLERTPIAIFPETYLNLRVTDFEKMSTGYIIAAQGAYSSASSATITYLFWLDEDGQLTHQRVYHQDFPGAVQEQFYSALYDIVEHENGWFSACGQAINFDGSHTWVVHLDPCGDIMYSGCLVDVVEQTGTPDLNAFPNPVTSRGTLHLDGDWSRNTLIRFFNTQGQLSLEYTVPFNTNLLAIPLPDLASGIYSVHGGDKVFRVVVE